MLNTLKEQKAVKTLQELCSHMNSCTSCPAWKCKYDGCMFRTVPAIWDPAALSEIEKYKSRERWKPNSQKGDIDDEIN